MMSTQPTWMIYGATGYTGRLIAAHAVERGHRPLLAGRSAEKLVPLARDLGLDYVVVALDETARLEQAVARCALVLHAAGPFIHTARPMMMACLNGGTHYLDITGEIDVFEMAFALDQRARAAGVCLLPGVGFDVIPTDCLAKTVAERRPDAVRLDIAFSAMGGLSPGTTKTALESLGDRGTVRRHGKLEPLPIGDGARTVQFSHKPLTVMPIPWGDLATAYRSTGIPNITTYLATPPGQIAWLRRLRGMMGILRWSPMQRLLKTLVERRIHGPDAEMRQRGRSYIWARAENSAGEAAEAWLEAAEGYQLTVWGSVLAAERLLDGAFQGPARTLTPSLAFGADFVLDLPGSQRYDALPADAIQ